jgi:hypothetical protein
VPFQPFYYKAQDRLPSKISWNSPTSKIASRVATDLVKKLKSEHTEAGITGKIRISSTSKIKKIRATKKNRIENGRRAINFGVNPHSNGLVFSRSILYFILRLTPKFNKITARAKTVKNVAIKCIRNGVKNF